MSKVILVFLFIFLSFLVHLSTQQESVQSALSPLSESIKKIFDHSHQKYSKSTRFEYMNKLLDETLNPLSQSTTVESGSWNLGDLTLYNENCDQSTLPFTQMKSTGNDITISHVIGSFQMNIGTIIQRPLSNLFNAILTYDGNSIPICFNFKDGQLAFTSDFLMCSSVDTFTPTCQTSGGNVYNIALLYKSPGAISGGVTAALVIGIVLVFLLCLSCCICCIVCLTRRRSEQYGRLN